MFWLVIILLVFTFQAATILLLEFRNPAKAVAWLFILFCVPLIGFVVYYFVAQDYSKRKKVRKGGSRIFREIRETIWEQAHIVEHADQMSGSRYNHQHRLFNLLSHLSESPITGCNRSQVLTNGEETFEAMLRAMEQAEHHLHVEFYIFRDDVISTKFQDVMIRKAKEGVKVRLICDGLGSHKMSWSFIRKFQDAGVEFHYFLPPLIATIDRRVNYRNHRKIVVVDGRIGFVGGINIGDDYLGQYPEVGFWRDTHVQIEGDAVYFLQNTFLNDWKLASGEQITEPQLTELFPPHNCSGEERIQILASGPDQDWDAIQEMCFGAISVACERIYITTPYFIPDPALYEAIKTAAVSGVDVKIIIPYQSDSRLVHLASLSYVEELLRAGVKFYQYRKGFVHAKVLIVDDLLATVGTANMDMRSFFCNFELTAVLFEKSSMERLTEDFERDLDECSQIDVKVFQQRSRWQKGAEMLSRMLSPLL
ncbi:MULTISPECIES: cardiolipin synthase [unclassified Paenibacillus]|uniref:cardiolipin synthase n=1 Tax=unclassified Paenibacillus TaxID=185978 RepID=UPI0009A5E1A7|nr:MULTISPECIES: cardiolipin synthase [unclassified Paenibacillus]SLK03438.1 cardiolipin synthase [Paenibacillus sp. RU5A]SOC69310.1 cardiolipin synthase [Paenibacillus sp. RU26A]SOC71755.1 cardiolipin synthase [Paenibacillus sp. RU5M]